MFLELVLLEDDFLSCSPYVWGEQNKKSHFCETSFIYSKLALRAMDVDKEFIKRVAANARLELSEKEVEKFVGQFMIKFRTIGAINIDTSFRFTILFFDYYILDSINKTSS